MKAGIKKLSSWTGKKHLFLVFLMSLTVFQSTGQTVQFDLKTSPNISFVFNEIEEYKTGLIIPNVVTLNVIATGTQWDLYVGATTTNPGYWDVVSTYGSTGDLPDVGLIELQFRNANNTSQVSGFFNLTDISVPTYIIGSAINPDPAVNCPLQGTNTAGSYVTDPQCYRFQVDMKIKPGFDYRPGLYTLRVDYIIVQDL